MIIQRENTKNFYELFKVVEDDIEKGADYDIHAYRRQAERICGQRTGKWAITALWFFALMVMTNVVGMFWISDLKHTIAKQKLIIECPAEDSIKFNCQHCGWPHCLSTLDTLTIKKQ